MASNEKRHWLDFPVLSGVSYIIDPHLPPDTFFAGMDGVFHIGAGTDLQLRLFWLNLTKCDRRFLKQLLIAVDDE